MSGIHPDLQAFFQENKPYVLNFLRSRYTKFSEDDLADIFQDAAIALHENIRSGKLTSLTTSLLNYFLSIANNMALRQVEKAKRKRTFSLDGLLSRRPVPVPLQDEAPFLGHKLNELDMLVSENEPADQQQANDAEERVRQLVLNMPAPCNKILWGIYWDDLSHQTLAQLYGYKNASVSKTTASRCRDKFSKALRQLGITSETFQA